MHPTLDLFATTGDDALLRVWDFTSRLVKRSIPLEMPSRCCAYSPDGRKLAIGFGAPKNSVNTRKYDGKFIIVESQEFQILHEARDSMKYLTVIKFSPNGELLVVGSSDFKIYLYNVLANYTMLATMSQHRSFITALDFSSDSSWLRSNCGGFELNYYEADTGMFIPNHTRMRDIEWASQSCTMGWAVQGLWSPYRDGCEVTASDVNFMRKGEGMVVVSGDNFGRISLTKYPCTDSKAISKRYRATSSPITRIAFNPLDSHVFAICGADKMILQFTHHRDISENLAYDSILREDDIEEGKESVLELYGVNSSSVSSQIIPSTRAQIGGRMWISYAVAPSSFTEADLTKPRVEWNLLHVFGVQNEMTRNCVHMNAEGDVIFPTSKYICTYNKKSNLQRFYTQHRALISCVAVSSDHRFIASAERSLRPNIYIWDASTSQVFTTLLCFHRRGVASMQFSNDNKLLLSVGLDQDRSIALWQSPSGTWVDGSLLSCSKGDVQPVVFASFYSHDEFVFASGGSCHIKFWNVNGRCLNPNYAEYPTTTKLGHVTCGAQVAKMFITGTASGRLLVWKGRKFDRAVKAHDGEITAIWTDALSGSGFITIARDGIVHQWKQSLEHLRNFSPKDADISPILHSLHSIDALLSTDLKSVNRMIATTFSAEIFEVAAVSGNSLLLLEGHYSGELWGLATHPLNPDLFLTAGDDCTIR